MPRVSTYLNFAGNTEEAFHFYKSVFGGEFEGGIHRFSDIPPQKGQPPIPDEAKHQVMHVQLEIYPGYVIMGTDAPESMGFKLQVGNNVYINLEPDTKEDVDRLFGLLSNGGKTEMQPQEMFWGAYYGSCTDKFGVQWMFNCASKQ